MKKEWAFLLAIIFGCSDESEIREYYENGNVKLIREINEDKLHGVSKSFYPNGNLEASEIWENGVLQGEAKLYFENGKPKGTVIYRDGAELFRSTIRYYNNGQIWSKFDDNEPIQKVYYEDGKIKEKQLYNSADSLLDFVKYDQNGEVNYVPRNTGFIDFSASEIDLDDSYTIEVNRDYDQWSDANLLVFINKDNSHFRNDTLPPIDNDLGYYKFEYTPKETGLYEFEMYFLNSQTTDTTSLYATRLIVK